MQKRVNRPFIVIIAAIAVLGLPYGGFSLTAPDTADHILVVYGLSSEQETQFGFDGKVSAFWASWDQSSTPGSPALDFIDLIVEKNAWEYGNSQFSGHGDAEVMVRAAWGAKGLYLYFKITDNSWLAVEDLLSFRLDSLSTQEIRNCTPTDCLLWPSGGGDPSTYWTVQYQTIVGGGSIYDTIGVYYFNFINSFMYWGKELFDSLPSRYDGLLIDMSAIDSVTKVMEWFVPWQWVGQNRSASNIPIQDERKAFYIVYRDVDPGEPPLPSRKYLEWKEPWPMTCPTPAQATEDPCFAWGDIEIGPSLASVVSVRPQPGHRNGSVPSRIAEYGTHPALYDLTGRRIDGGRTGYGGVVMKSFGGRGRLQMGVGKRNRTQ